MQTHWMNERSLQVWALEAPMPSYTGDETPTIEASNEEIPTQWTKPPIYSPESHSTIHTPTTRTPNPLLSPISMSTLQLSSIKRHPKHQPYILTTMIPDPNLNGTYIQH